MDYLPKGEGISKQFGGFNVTVKQITEKSDFVETVLSIADGKVRKRFPFFFTQCIFLFSPLYRAQKLLTERTFFVYPRYRMLPLHARLHT